MSKRYLLITAIVIFLLGGLLLFWNKKSDSNPSDKEISSPAPGQSVLFDLNFTDYDGQQVNFADFTGQPLVINSWAAWCTFCKQELIDFADLQDEFGEQITIIAINRQEPLPVVKEFSSKIDVTGRIILLLDSTDSFYRAIDGFSMPETVFVDTQGNQVYHKRGVMDKDEIRERINSLIEEN